VEIFCRACNCSNQPGSLSCSNCGKRLLDENRDLRDLLLERRDPSNSGEPLSNENRVERLPETVGSEPRMGIGMIEEPSPIVQPHWSKDPAVQALMSLPALGILLAAWFALTPLVRHMSLRSDVANGKVVEIANFIRANAGSSSRGDDALFAIDEAMKSGSPVMVPLSRGCCVRRAH
jgi:hypothetical protein